MKKNNEIKKKIFPIYFLLIALFLTSCKEDDNPLAPYAGNKNPVKISKITIEADTFNPKLTWIGGYVSVLGVNRGSRAALDTSLVWLIKTEDNNLKYPVQFGEIPEGAADLTAQFGGTLIDTLSEDQTYTFWLLKEDVWNQVSSNPDAKLVVDSLLSTSQVVTGDSIRINPFSYNNLVKPLDVFINISDIVTFGGLADIFITETKSNIPLISWTLNNSSDSLIAVIGIAEGNAWTVENVKWDVYSERDSSGTLIYGKDNVIAPPLFIGEEIPQAREFVEFTLEGLERNKTYYLWLASKDWNGVNRTRFAQGYSFATFNVK